MIIVEVPKRTQMSHAPKKKRGGASKARAKSRPKSARCALAGGCAGAAELLKPLADAALLTTIRGYLLGPDRYHEALAVMEAGSAALAAAQKAKTLLLQHNSQAQPRSAERTSNL